MKFPLLALAVVCLSACTNINVQRVASGEKQIKLIYILENHSAPNSEVLHVLENGIRRHGIEATVIQTLPPSPNDFLLTYTARNGWDLAPFLKHAELRLKRGGKVIGSATYHHHGGLDFGKFASEATKLDPVIDQLFAGYQ